MRIALHRLFFAAVLAIFAPCALGADAPAADAPATPESLAEPNWTLGLRLPEEMVGKRSPTATKADVLVYLPKDAKRITSMLLIPNNSDSKNFGEHAALHAVADKHKMAIVYLRNFNPGIEHRAEAPESDKIQPLMDLLAAQTKIPEFKHAPWITFGKSSRGEFPFRMAWVYPKRTIASVTYHGETPTWPPAPWAKLDGETILSVNMNGESEWGGTWYIHVRPSLLNYRAKKSWLSHQAIARGVGHGDYVDGNGGAGWGKPVPAGVTSCLTVWDYLSLFVDKALELRLPKDKFPTDAPLALNQVDESKGYLIDPFAIEELYRVPHLPLKQGPDGLYIAGNKDEAPVDGFAAMSPLKDFAVADGVPVVAYESAKSPRQWLLTESLKFAMAADPMTELPPELARLMPKPGDQVSIDGKTITFQPIIPKYVGPNGGIALKTGLRPTNGKITLLCYTVLEFAKPTMVKVQAGYTAATRIQMVINGKPVKHKQVLAMEPGKYPMLVILRMTANWDRIEPSLADASPEDVSAAKEMQAEADRRAAEQAKLDAAGEQPPKVLIRKAADVPPAERGKYFWVADKELAEAWFKLHAIRGQKPQIP